MIWGETQGGSDEWYTPPYIFDALKCTFDLDVAHPANLKTHVPARRNYSDGSLERPWEGFVWMNPPFGGRNGLVPWLNKFIAHGNGICLTPDRTSAPWFQEAVRSMDLILFLSPKVKFEKPDGTRAGTPAQGTVLMAIGQKGVAALTRGARLGWLCVSAPIALEMKEAA